MGAVYIAINERLRKEVALKVLTDELAFEPEVAERFIREAMSASAARHPGVVEIYDADSDDGVLWIAMEKLDGESLEDRLKRGALPAQQVFVIMAQVASALAAVHAVGVVHRDLKPGNIFLERLPTGEERVKILDFGIAKSSFEGMGKVTRTGMTVGTPDYLAPEQAMGGSAIDHRTDIYAVGVILFEALTGTMPYDASSFGELVAKMVQQGPKDLTTILPGVAPAIASLVNLCLSVDPSSRPQSAQALLVEMNRQLEIGIAPTGAMALSAVPRAVALGSRTPLASTIAMASGDIPIGASGAPTPAPLAPAPKSKTGLIAIVIAALGIGAVLLVGAAGIGLFAFKPSEDDDTGEPGPIVEPVDQPTPTEPPAAAGCTTSVACPLRERCNFQTHVCEPAPLWSDTRIRYADQPEIRLTDAMFCDATLTTGRPSSLLLRYQQGGGYTVWSLTLPGDITVGEHALLRRAPPHGPALYVAESNQEQSARLRGGWQQTGGTLTITSVDMRYGGHVSGSIRADLAVPRSDPPLVGSFTATFHADLPE